jgi:hypothetical protein
MIKYVLDMLCQIPFDVICPLQNNLISQFPMLYAFQRMMEPTKGLPIGSLYISIRIATVSPRRSCLRIAVSPVQIIPAEYQQNDLFLIVADVICACCACLCGQCTASANLYVTAHCSGRYSVLCNCTAC